MEDRLDKLEKLILTKNKETMERLSKIHASITVAIQRLQEDNFNMKSDLEEHVSNNDDHAVKMEILNERVNNLESQQENRKRWFV